LKKGIKTKLISSLILTTLVILAIFVGISSMFLRNYSKNDLDRTIYLIGENTSSLMQAPIYQQDYNQLKSIISRIRMEDFE